MEPEDDQAYDLIRRYLLKGRGFDLSGYSQSFISRSIRKRIGRRGCGTALEYVGLLRRDDEEVNELILALSVNVTDFFRDDDAFTALSSLVIRPLVSQKVEQGWSALRIWSAGCATGQETYTIAICVAEELRKLRPESDLVVRIIGTDLSKKALGYAQRGLYTPDQVKGVPRRILSEYFSATDSGHEIVPLIKRDVKFSEGNLLNRPEKKFFDVVVCRNVVIYFSRPMHDKVITNFHLALKSGGYLMLGRTETLLGSPRRLFEAVDHENRIFRKRPVGVGEMADAQATDSAAGGASDSAHLRFS
jgi:chemotaxis methyl-accepting protein methylase